MKKIKTISKKEERAFKESQVMVLLEDIRDDIKLLAERVMGTNEKVDRIEKNLEDFKTEMYDFRVEVNKFKTEMYDFNKETRDNFKLVMEHFSNIDDELVEIKAEIKYLKQVLTSKADQERLEDLEERVKTLEQERMMVRDGKEKYKVG